MVTSWGYFLNQLPILWVEVNMGFGPSRWDALNMGIYNKVAFQECKGNFIFEARMGRAKFFGWVLFLGVSPRILGGISQPSS